jgi:hypothetical protein
MIEYFFGWRREMIEADDRSPYLGSLNLGERDGNLRALGALTRQISNTSNARVFVFLIHKNAYYMI